MCWRDEVKRKHTDLPFSDYQTIIGKGFKPEDGILITANDIGAQMIGLATHSYKGLVHLFIGSIAEDVVNHAKIPVWTCTTKS